MSDQPPAPPLPERVAAAVLSHPAVARLDGGPFGSVASYLPGRRVIGVRADEPDEAHGGSAAGPVEVSVVVRWPAGVSLPVLAGEIAALVRDVAGERPVDVTVADLVPAPGPADARGAGLTAVPAPAAGALAAPAGGGPPTRPGPAGTPGARLA
ncbi:hypothetical protein [Pseudonocardia terrae]|uniref:hypothetical protein n=1 Tax=Pseudonocardia terrae TaxID=2905831 RepID=UPI0027DF68C1|nr:hypothetical protein [Pseudonocardia terrae]